MRVSVIVPTKDRVEPLTRLLRALERQDPVEGGFEVIVVADGCSESTIRRLRMASCPFPYHVLEQPASGAASARNCGAALASGSVLLFLDDDVEPERGVLRAHAALHDSDTSAIGVGYLPPVVAQRGFFGMSLRAWWESMFDGPRRPHHRYTYKDLLSGHFSIPAPLFEALGGFDATLRCHEDYELGYRAIQAGLRIRFIPDAVAWHHETSDLRKALRRKFEEGVADVRLAERYPDLIPSLPLSRPPGAGRLGRLFHHCAWERPRVGELLASRVLGMLDKYERWRLRFRWRARLEALMVFWYWRGVASAAHTRVRFASIVAAQPRPAQSELVIDLAMGLDRAEAELDARRPRSARLTLGPHEIGEILDLPGAERLRGPHLRPLIARQFAASYLRAASAEGLLPTQLDRSRELCAI